MDQDLIEYLQAMEHRLNKRMDILEHRIADNGELLTLVKESLEREMNAGFERILVRMDTMERRLDRHGSLLQTGARWTARMAAWSDRVDKGDGDRDIRIGGLARRLLK